MNNYKLFILLIIITIIVIGSYYIRQQRIQRGIFDALRNGVTNICKN